MMTSGMTRTCLGNSNKNNNRRNQRTNSFTNVNTSFALPLVEGLLARQKCQIQQQKEVENGDDKTAVLNGTSANTFSSIVELALRQEESVCLIQRMTRTRLRTRQHDHQQQTKLTAYMSTSAPTSNTSISKKRSNDVESPVSSKKLKVSAFKTSAGYDMVRQDHSKCDTYDSTISELQRNSSLLAIVDQKGNTTSDTTIEHWLWRSLRAYSLDERKSVIRILLSTVSLSKSTTVTPSVSSSDPSDKKVEFLMSHFQQKHLRCRLSNQIMRLLDRYVIPNPLSPMSVVDFSYSSTIGMGPSKSHLALEWIAILEILWTSIFSPLRVNCGNHCPKNERQMTTTSTSFGTIPNRTVAKQYWIWLTNNIWMCACQLKKKADHYVALPDITDSAVALASLSHLALVLAIRRELLSVPHSTKSSTGKTKAGVCKSSSSTTTVPTSNKKAGVADARQRSNSSSSNVSPPSMRQRSNSASGNCNITSNNATNVDQVLKSIQYFNSALLWDLSDTVEGVDQLSPLACLIGACWIARDMSLHLSLDNSTFKPSPPGRTNRPTENRSSCESKAFYGGGNFLLSAGGGGNVSGTLVALRRAAHSLEQLICFSKECEVNVVDDIDEKKKDRNSHDEIDKRKASTIQRIKNKAPNRTYARDKRSLSRRVIHRHVDAEDGLCNMINIDNEHEDLAEYVDDDEDDIIDDDDDDIVLEATDLEDDDRDEEDEDAAAKEDCGSGDINLKDGSTASDTKEKLDTDNRSKRDRSQSDESRGGKAEDDDGGEEDHCEADIFEDDEEFSHIVDEEEDDIESMDRDEEDGIEEQEDNQARMVVGADDNDEITVALSEEIEPRGAHSQMTDTTQASHDIEVEVDEDEEDEDEEEDDDEDEDGDDDDDDCAEEVEGMDLEELTAAVEHAKADMTSRSTSNDTPLNTESCGLKLSPPIEERKEMYVKACMQVLCAQYPNNTMTSNHVTNRRPLLSPSAEDALLGTLNDIVKPPKKPLNIQIMMRRAPTQEEFFRGSLSQNPILLSRLVSTGTENSHTTSRLSGVGGSDSEPTVGDLRQHIANDLQMSDSAEMIEIIVANRILDVGLKLRVVHQVLWKNHLMENSTSLSGSSASALFGSGGGGTSYFASAGSTISMIFSSAGGSSERSRGSRDTMVATYRLVGVDGEATEDTVRIDDLPDPEKPSEAASHEEAERLLEIEYAFTKLVTHDRGFLVLLRCVQRAITGILRRIRRDDVGCHGNQNPTRIQFKSSPPCHALTLLRHCARIAVNRKKLLLARAPTVLLTLLLDVLKIIEDETSTSDTALKSNRTAELLQELIEVLTSDISSSADVEQVTSHFAVSPGQDVSSMPLLLESIETISLSPPLRNVIAKLLPFLTYGQKDLSRELADRFKSNIVLDHLADYESEIPTIVTSNAVLMTTFVQAVLSLQTSSVCNTLRLELLNCDFHDRIAGFILQSMPHQPPPWSVVLYTDDSVPDQQTVSTKILEVAWREFYFRGGLKTAFKMITSLCMNHDQSQIRMALLPGFLKCCHWIETTLDNVTANVDTKGLGLMAETFLDELVCKEAIDHVDSLRKQTRARKKQIAENRRKAALRGMNKFSAVPSFPNLLEPVSCGEAVSILAPVDGLLHGANALISKKAMLQAGNTKKPEWLTEAETLEDEEGLTCAVCKEGRTLKPNEVIGLYAYVKRIAIPIEQCGSRADIDGSNLFRALPSVLPDSLIGSYVDEEWFPRAKSAADQATRAQSTVNSNVGGRNSIFTTTVAAGTGIHISCHRKARQEDRSHPKAPKSEWEGASLRNNRCNCNVILPLVSSRSSKVPLIAVDAALTDHQAAVSNLLGSNPKSSLWTVLHDVRFLLLRMAYGEALNVDCGGGSLASNCQLLFYEMLMADMFHHDAQIDQPHVSHHVRGLSCAVLSGCAVLTSKDAVSGDSLTALARGVADAAPMACLTCILFHNCQSDESKVATSGESSSVHPKRQWVVGSDYFLKSLLICAGRRHAQGIDSSGCQSNKNHRTTVRRLASFADWDILNDNETGNDGESGAISEELENVEGIAALGKQGKRCQQPSTKASLEDFQNVLRPMITLYAIINQLSVDFSVSLDDSQIYECSQRLENVITTCQSSKNIRELLSINKISLMSEDMIELLQMGMVVAA